MKNKIIATFLLINQIITLQVFTKENYLVKERDFSYYESITTHKYKKESSFQNYTLYIKEKLYQSENLTETKDSNSIEILEEDEVKLIPINFEITDEIVWTTTSVNIKEKPNKESNKIDILPYKNKIKRIGIGDNGWSKVVYDNKECYIDSSYLTTEEPKEIINTEIEGSLLQNNFIKKEGNVNDSFISLADSYFNKIPKNVRNFLINNDVKIYITDTNLAERFFQGTYSSVMGVTLYAEKTIYIEDRNNAIKNSIIHELGHIIDSLNGTLSLTTEWQDIYNAEKNNFVEVGKADNHSISSSMEYFAEVFNQTILHSDTCSTSAPRSYEYILNLINNL